MMICAAGDFTPVQKTVITHVISAILNFNLQNVILALPFLHCDTLGNTQFNGQLRVRPRQDFDFELSMNVRLNQRKHLSSAWLLRELVLLDYKILTIA